MSRPTPDLSLEVDLTNPGQFLACCGLLELASRVDADSLGWFEERKFHLSCGESQLLEKFIRCAVTPITANGREDSPTTEEEGDNGQKEPKSPPVLLGEPFNLVLDWWTDKDPSARNAKLITWSGGANIPSFFIAKPARRGARNTNGSMRDHFSRHLSRGKEHLLMSTEAITSPAPFNFDSRLSRNSALHLGFVPDKKKQPLAFSPAVEVLCLVGIQRFRPRMEVAWDRNIYHLWREPLPVSVAAAVAHGLIPTLSSGKYAFTIIRRDSEGKRKLFGPAQPAQLERSSHAQSR